MQTLQCLLVILGSDKTRVRDLKEGMRSTHLKNDRDFW